MNYESERIVGGPRWHGCVDANPDWAQLFGKTDGEDPWLTPRMAMRIYFVTIWQVDGVLEDFNHITMHPRLPKIARKFFQKEENWRLAFRDCYARIGMRLQKGLDPSPNCTGEEMAFHNIMQQVPDAEGELFGNKQFKALPKYPEDDDYEGVLDLTLSSDAVLNLFDPGDLGVDYSDDEDEPNDNDNYNGPSIEELNNLDPASLARFVMGSSLSSFLGGIGADNEETKNLQPKNWFVAFRNDRFRNHI